MITTPVLLTQSASLDHITHTEKFERGDPARALTPADLLAFGRCPRRWRDTPDDDDPLAALGPSLVEWLALDPALAAKHYVRRPESYEAMRLECPRCGSEGPARSCTKCGTSRKNVVRPRPWTAAAKQCAAWLEQHQAQNLRVVPPKEWDRAAAAAANLVQDKAFQHASHGSSPLHSVHGRWHDPATKLHIPVWSRISACPASDSSPANCLLQIVQTSNADPLVWEANAFRAGLHIAAAFALALWNALDISDVRDFYWLLVERDEPFLVARRRASPELLDEGRKRLAELMASYAQCLVRNQWPAFEPDDDTTNNAWAPVALQPWLTSGHGAFGGYFAPLAVAETGAHDARHAKAT